MISPDRLAPALRPGDRIAVVAPSSSVEFDRVQAGCEVLEGWGFEPVLGPNLQARLGHLAGTDVQRATDINLALRDHSVRAIWAARGGAGATRILDLIDWAALGRDPKLLVGFSDITALHAGARVRTGVPGVHGQFVGRLDLQDEVTSAWLLALVTGEVGDGSRIPIGPGDELVSVVGGVGEGPMIGGNLATLTSLLGTADEPDTRGCVLLLEEVNEPPHRIDRWLVQLLRSTLLDEITGIVIGRFAGCEPLEGQRSWTTDEVIDDVLGDLDIPVVTGWSLGHTDQQVAVPMGTTVRLDGDARTLTLLEDVVAPRP